MPQRALNVLIADDEPTICEFLGETLKQLGHNAVFVESGEAARAELSEKTYHILISDFIMPKLDGYELLSWLRSRGSVMYFVLISGYYNQSIERAFKELGADEIIAKPFRIENLRQIIANYERKAGQASSSAFVSPQAAMPSASAVPAGHLQGGQFAPALQESAAAATDLSQMNAASALAMLAAEIPGFAAASVMSVNTLTRIADVVKDEAIELDTLTSYNRDLIELKRQALDALGLQDERIFDIITTTASYVHFVKLVGDGKTLIYLVAQKKYTNIGIVRHVVSKYAGVLAS